eukprot:7384143-Prymnesium_polylepis.3
MRFAGAEGRAVRSRTPKTRCRSELAVTRYSTSFLHHRGGAQGLAPRLELFARGCAESQHTPHTALPSAPSVLSGPRMVPATPWTLPRLVSALPLAPHVSEGALLQCDPTRCTASRTLF